MNDTHSHLYPWKDEKTGREYGGAARWATVIKNIRQEAEYTLFLHAGDMLVGSDGNYLTNMRPNWERLPGYGYRGLLEIPLFGMLGLDAAVFGNHEFDYGLYWNYHLFKDASFDMLAANLSIRPSPVDGSRELPYFVPYKVYRKGPFSIGVIGLGTGEYLKTLRLEAGDPVSAASPLVESLRKECDIVLALSHLGTDRDEELAFKVPGIDVIVGGHSHTYLPQPRMAGETIITQTRCWGEYVGRLDLEYRGGKLSSYEYTLVPADFSVPEDPEIRSWLDGRLYPLSLRQSLEADTGGQGEGRASLGDYLAAAVEQEFKADMILIKSGKYRGVLEAGPVSARDFFTLLWPYRKRAEGPEKDLGFEQLRAALAMNPGHLVLKDLLERVSGLTTLIRCGLPEPAAAELEAFAGSSAGYTLRKTGNLPQGGFFTAVLDLPSWIDLYREGILKADSPEYRYESLEREIIEVLLK
jgi:2',3'-cyclic-nucleotide 2'-phosphodiesterase (5'-nucleotidase family)